MSVFGGNGVNARLSSIWGEAITTRFSASYNDKALSPKASDFKGYIIPNMPYREVHAGTFISSGLITGTGYMLNAGIESSYTITPSSKLTFTGDLTYFRGSGWFGSHELQTGFYLQPRLLGSTTTLYPNGGFNMEYVVLRNANNPAAGYVPFRRTYRDPALLQTSDLEASDNAVYVQALPGFSTQPTYHGFGRQGTHYKKGSSTQVKVKCSCLSREQVKLPPLTL